MVNQNKATRIRNQDTIHFENAIYKVLHLRSSITAPFAEHLKFQEKMTYTHLLWSKGAEQNKKTELEHYKF